MVAAVPVNAADFRLKAIRAAAYGFASLEAAGGFGPSDDLDAAYDLLVNWVHRRAYDVE